MHAYCKVTCCLLLPAHVCMLQASCCLLLPAPVAAATGLRIMHFVCLLLFHPNTGASPDACTFSTSCSLVMSLPRVNACTLGKCDSNLLVHQRYACANHPEVPTTTQGTESEGRQPTCHTHHTLTCLLCDMDGLGGGRGVTKWWAL
jgi:hypothetical protein